MTVAYAPMPCRYRWTVRQYNRLADAGIFNEDDRVELIRGDIIVMAPIGSIHAGTVNQLGNLLKAVVGDAAIVAVQDPLVLEPDSEPQPDLMLLRPRVDFYKYAHPEAQDVLLIIEVADSTLPYDRDTKMPLYASAGIPEAWLVDVTNRQLLIHHSPAKQGYQLVTSPAALDQIPLPGLPGKVINLGDLF